MLDGFPETEKAAVEIEKRLSGLDLEAEATWIQNASKLAPPPSEFVPNLNRNLISALDIIFLLNSKDSDILTTRCIERERSQTQISKKGKPSTESMDEHVVLS